MSSWALHSPFISLVAEGSNYGILWRMKCMAHLHTRVNMFCKLSVGFVEYVEACPYSMEGKKLERSEEEKDLGVFIDTNLNFDKHISSTINKANSIAGLIRCSFEYLDAPMFKMLFTALVRPHLEYAQSVWSSYLKKKHIEAIEKDQRRASKRVPELANMTYEDRLCELKLPTLCHRRYRGDMIEIFKIHMASMIT